MEKRSHRRIRDLDVLTAFQGLVANEIGCARISMMAREQETLPAMGRIQMRETNYLQIITSGLHRTAGPYKSTWLRRATRRSELGHVPAQSYAAHRGHGFVRGSDHRLYPAPRSGHCPAGSARACLDQCDRAPDGRMDRAASEGSLPLE